MPDGPSMREWGNLEEEADRRSESREEPEGSGRSGATRGAAGATAGKQ